MKKNEIYQEYLKLLNEKSELEDKIKNLIKKCNNGETFLSDESIQQTIEKGYERLENLKKQIDSLESSLNSYDQKEDDKRMADISIQHYLGERPTNMNIVGGILTTTAADSHLVAEKKSPEQLEQEKKQILAKIKSKVQSGEISLAEASKLINDVNISFGYYDEITETNTSSIHK